MAVLWEILFLPVAPFVGHPERAWLVAGLLAILIIYLTGLRKFRPWHHLPIVLGALAWGGFGILEQKAVAQGWNIRLDLLLVAPLLSAVSIWAGWAGLLCLAEKRAETVDADQTSSEAGAEDRQPGNSALP